MAQRIHWTRLLIGGLAILAILTWSEAKAEDVKSPEFKHAMEVKVRKTGEKDFDKAAKIGIEVFLDPNTNRLIYVSEKGSIAVRPAPTMFDPKPKAPVWSHGMELKIRKAGEVAFDEKTEKIGLEVYHDVAHGNLIFVTERGGIAVIPGKGVDGKAKDPEWSHAMEISVRKAGEAKFSPTTRKVGVEVYYDPNGGNLIYISDTGSITVQPGTKITEGKGKSPEWKAAMELRVRKSTEKFFDEKNVKHGVEVYQDENNGKLLFLSETGALASLSTPFAADAKKDPEWKYGLVVRARKAGEIPFTDATLKVGLEVYTQDGTNAAIYVTESSFLSVVPK